MKAFLCYNAAMLTFITLVILPLFLVLLSFTVLVHIFFLIPYVPSSNQVVRRMVRAADIRDSETVYDLGCGDGRLLTAAEKKPHVKAVGFEIAPLIYMLAHLRLLWERSNASVRFKNMFHVNLRPANVIFCYLFPNVMPRLAEKIKKECRRGTRIVSNTFTIPGLKLARTIAKDPRRGIPTIYVYKV